MLKYIGQLRQIAIKKAEKTKVCRACANIGGGE
jgi:hypothetical protein